VRWDVHKSTIYRMIYAGALRAERHVARARSGKTAPFSKSSANGSRRGPWAGCVPARKGGDREQGTEPYPTGRRHIPAEMCLLLMLSVKLLRNN
jgi:hypothetical protein